MATQTVISTFLSGRTSHSFRLRNQSTGAIVDTQAATETASGSGVYTAAFTDIPAGTYTLQFIRISDSLVVDDKVVTLTLATATFVAKLAVELDSSASEQLDEMQATLAVLSGQLTGARLSSAGPVTPAGDIILVVGSDYVADIDSSLTRTISDAGETLYDKLNAGDLSELMFSASPAAGSDDTEKIAGTITAVTKLSGITSVTIAIARAAIPAGGPFSDEWTYQIWRVTDDHVSPPLLEGCLELRWRA